MILKIKGMKAAKLVANLMEELTGYKTCPYRGGREEGRTYWVGNVHLDRLGEQIVLEALPEGSLILVEQATYKKVQPIHPTVKQW